MKAFRPCSSLWASTSSVGEEIGREGRDGHLLNPKGPKATLFNRLAVSVRGSARSTRNVGSARVFGCGFRTEMGQDCPIQFLNTNQFRRILSVLTVFSL